MVLFPRGVLLLAFSRGGCRFGQACVGRTTERCANVSVIGGYAAQKQWFQNSWRYAWRLVVDSVSLEIGLWSAFRCSSGL